MTGSRSSRDILSRPAPDAAATTAGRGGRLIALVVGIDRYEDPAVPDLTCGVNDAESVAGAIAQTQAAEALELALLTSPAREINAQRPTRQAILDAARQVAASAGTEDTVFLYFAGHGGMLRTRPCLFPDDVRVLAEGNRLGLEGGIAVDELQEVFQACPCRRRVMFLDCCQNAFSAGDAAETWPLPESGPVGRAVPWRTGMPLAAELVDAFQQSSQGWSLVLACGPGEVSLEDPEWGAHGIFSHFLATGLRGEADLDGDDVVSLPELVQFLAARTAKQAEAVIEELRDRGGPAPTQHRQNPFMIWNGPIAFPLTRRLDERRAGWRGGLLRLWLGLLTQPLPYALAVEGMVRYGTAVLYALVMALAVWLFIFHARGESSFAPIAVVALGSGLLWLANFALAGAANEHRWHSGGYLAGILTAAWHALVFVLLAGLPVRADPQAALQFAVRLLVVLSVMIVFGHNALHGIIALADLVKRDLRVAGRRAFRQLERQWIHADIDNMIAMVSAHPKLYLLLGLAVAVLAIGHAGYSLATLALSEGAALHLAFDFLLLVLVQWQVHWFAASYRKLRGILLPER
jgi:uncharacterized caspase-like protein